MAKIVFSEIWIYIYRRKSPDTMWRYLDKYRFSAYLDLDKVLNQLLIYAENLSKEAKEDPSWKNWEIGLSMSDEQTLNPTIVATLREVDIEK